MHTLSTPTGTDDPVPPPTRFGTSRTGRVGASIGGLGALLVLGGVFLPTYGPSDYEPAFLQNAPVWMFAQLIAPSLLFLGLSIWCWFRKLWCWLVVLGLAVLLLALLLHLLIGIAIPHFSCWLSDATCSAPPIQYGTGFWLPLAGFLLSGFGIVTAAIASAHRHTQETHKQPT